MEEGYTIITWGVHFTGFADCKPNSNTTLIHPLVIKHTVRSSCPIPKWMGDLVTSHTWSTHWCSWLITAQLWQNILDAVICSAWVFKGTLTRLGKNLVGYYILWKGFSVFFLS